MKRKLPKSKTPSFVSEVERLSRPFLREFAASVQDSLNEVVLQAVTRFFNPTPTANTPNPQPSPAQFKRIGASPNAGWFNMKKIGNTLQGKLLGMFARPDELSPSKVSHFFQIQLSSPCEVRLGHGEDSALVLAKIGDVVNLNYGPKTEELEHLLKHMLQGAEFKIYGTVTNDAIKLSGGRTMHSFELFSKMTTLPDPSLPTTTPEPKPPLRGEKLWALYSQGRQP
jgi:hypothetical protein